MDFLNPAFSLFAMIGIMGALVLTVVGGLIVWAYLHTYSRLFWDGRRLMGSLRKQGRTLSPEEAAARYGRGDGIILVEGPTLGWPIYRIWWSSDDGYLPRETEAEYCTLEDHANYERFVDPDKGCAKLVCPFISGKKMQAYINGRFGIGGPYLFIYTGGVLCSRVMKEEAGKSRD